MAEKYIHIKGARVNNLKNLEVKIGKIWDNLPQLSKSSLALSTAEADGLAPAIIFASSEIRSSELKSLILLMVLSEELSL